MSAPTEAWLVGFWVIHDIEGGAFVTCDEVVVVSSAAAVDCIVDVVEGAARSDHHLSQPIRVYRRLVGLRSGLVGSTTLTVVIGFVQTPLRASGVPPSPDDEPQAAATSSTTTRTASRLAQSLGFISLVSCRHHHDLAGVDRGIDGLR